MPVTTGTERRIDTILIRSIDFLIPLIFTHKRKAVTLLVQIRLAFMDKHIELKGVRVNNLKNISLNIPRNKFIAIAGVSGSGKSSLAFDTLYAEGQRRYVESRD